MLKRFSSHGEKLLVLGIIVFLIIAYELAFRKTLEVYQMNRELNLQLNKVTDFRLQPAYILRTNKNLDKTLFKYSADSLLFRSTAISKIAEVAGTEHVRLSEVPVADPSFHHQNYFIQKLTFEGDYFGLMRLIKDLQRTEGIGVLRSLECYALKSNRQGTGKVMRMDIFLEFLRN